jgi:polynucleotide 5'-kinase involved in rRNA processing
VSQVIHSQREETERNNTNNAKTFLEEKTNATARSREERAYLRNERKKERLREQTKEKIF